MRNVDIQIFLFFKSRRSNDLKFIFKIVKNNELDLNETRKKH